MKQRWEQLTAKIDALTLRERALFFIVMASAVLAISLLFFLEPLWMQQKQLSQQMRLKQQEISGLQTQIAHILKQRAADPDAANRMRLQTLRQHAEQLHGQLQSVQQQLVSADNMAGLLEDILQRSGKLRLTGLKTLPVTQADQSLQPKPQAGQPKEAVADNPVEHAVYRHGVEIAVQGGYLDILAYLVQLENLPSQMFWGKAELQVEEHPTATLRLTLYTLSLDKKWLNL